MMILPANVELFNWKSQNKQTKHKNDTTINKPWTHQQQQTINDNHNQRQRQQERQAIVIKQGDNRHSQAQNDSTINELVRKWKWTTADESRKQWFFFMHRINMRHQPLMQEREKRSKLRGISRIRNKNNSFTYINEYCIFVCWRRCEKVRKAVALDQSCFIPIESQWFGAIGMEVVAMAFNWLNECHKPARPKALGIFSLVQLKLAGLFWPVVEPWLLFQLLRRPKGLPCRPKRSSVGVAQCDRKILNATISNLAGTVNQLLSRQTVFCCYF